MYQLLSCVGGCLRTTVLWESPMPLDTNFCMLR